ELRYQLITLGGKGAEPLTARRQASSPKAVSSFLRNTPLRPGTLSRILRRFSGILLNRPSWNFNHSLGTDWKTVGLARCISALKVSRLSAKNTVQPDTKEEPSMA